jgi:SH3-like domain-containing protein
MPRKIVAGALALAVLAPTAQAVERRCDIEINVVDQDAAGMNVCAAPGGAVTGALKAKGRWVQVHLVGQDGEWMRFDNAWVVDDNLPDGESPLKPNKGWAHINGLGMESVTAGAEVHVSPDEDSRVLVRGGADPDKEPRLTVLGCDGEWLQVRWKGAVGWTRGYCANQYTTCS